MVEERTHKVWVLDPAYNDAAGHHTTYLKSIALEMPTTDFHCYASFDKMPERITPNTMVEPLFVGNVWYHPVAALRDNGYYLDGGIAYTLSMAGPRDHVFIPTLEAEIAASLARALKTRPQPTHPFVHAVIHHVDNDIMGPVDKVKPAYTRLNQACSSGRGIAYYAPFSGLIPLIQQGYGFHAEEALHVFPGIEVHRQKSPKRGKLKSRFTIGMIGNARPDKGLHLMPYLIKYMKEAFPKQLAKTNWLVQSFKTDQRMDHIVAQFREAVDGTGAQLLLDIGQKDDAEYLNVLESVDIVALPYNRNAFSGRGSGIAVDATLLGKPFIYTSGLILGEHAPGSALPAETLDEFARHLVKLMQNYAPYARAANLARVKILQTAKTSKLFTRLASPAR